MLTPFRWACLSQTGLLLILFNLQVIRGLAAYGVVYHHSVRFLEAECGLPTTPIGQAGVDIFFIISGFIMVYIQQQRPVGPVKFLKLRVCRVIPLYWLATFGAFGLVLVAPQFFGSTTADPMDLLKSLLFVPYTKGNGMIQPVVYVGWTLNFEMFFYLVFALSLCVGRYSTWVALAGIAGLVLLGMAYVFSPSEETILFFYTAPLMLDFGVGMLLA